jgi:hypothetical protein
VYFRPDNQYLPEKKTHYPVLVLRALLRRPDAEQIAGRSQSDQLDLHTAPAIERGLGIKATVAVSLHVRSPTLKDKR